jgi:hypothetical protein
MSSVNKLEKQEAQKLTALILQAKKKHGVPKIVKEKSR